MKRGERRLKRGLVRILELPLTLSTSLISLPGRKFRGPPPTRPFSHLICDYSKAQCLAALLFVSGGALVSLQLELILFTLVDHYVCVNLFQRQAYITPHEVSSAKLQFLPSNQMIVRAVYLDPRPRNGFVNTSVFLVELHKELLAREAIVACGTGSGISTTLTVRLAMNSRWAHETEPHLTHDVAMIDCFGLPDTPSGSRAFLWYEHGRDDRGQTQLHRVESEQRYFVPLLKQTRNEDDVKIVLCTAIVRDFPAYMKEFLRYYKYLGVDHVYIMGEDSFFRNGILENDAFIQNALMDGYMSFTLWHPWLNSDQMFYHSQMLAHQDCIYRFQGTYDYAFLVDSDDHFIPLVPRRNTLDFYVGLYCRFGSCIFAWLEYFPDCGQHWTWLGPHGNVTNTLVSHTHQRRLRTGKSIHRLSAILDAGTHKPQQLLTGYHSVFVPPSVAYVAHIRKNLEPPNGLQSC